MYLCKRKANKFRNLATLIFLNIAILGCSFSPVNSDSEIIVNKIKFDPSVPIKIKNNLNIFVKENEASSTEVNIIGFEFKENNFYGGENLGSLESEVVGSIQVYILNNEEHSKKISSSKRFNTPNNFTFKGAKIFTAIKIIFFEFKFHNVYFFGRCLIFFNKNI